MNAFVDPRTDSSPRATRLPPRTTADPDELRELHELCREGRLYDVEDWIRSGRPVQLEKGPSPSPRHWRSALEIALEDGNHALLLLLLCNGYDPNLEEYSPLNRALRSRRLDLLDLLLEWGADPHRVDLDDLFGTYTTEMFERFQDLGVDLTAGHVLAENLAHHTSNTPLFGFAKRYCGSDPKMQRELDMALVYHATEGNERGVALSLWAGADPHATAPNLRYHWKTFDDEEDEDGFPGYNAVHYACSNGHVEILERLGPDPSLDDFEELYWSAGSGAVVEYLATWTLPEDVGRIISWHTNRIRLGFGRTWRPFDVLKRLFKVGARWEESTSELTAAVRWNLLKVSDDAFVDLLKLFATEDYVSPEILKDLGRTPAIRRKMKKVGFIRPPSHESGRSSRSRARPRPTRSREVLKKFGVEVSKRSKKKAKKKPEKREHQIPRSVTIGTNRQGAKELRLDRRNLYERVWSEPVSTLAEKWGVSDRGLAKTCSRLKIPTPPRGYWAKMKAGKRVRRANLPTLKPGQAEEIVVWEG